VTGFLSSRITLWTVLALAVVLFAVTNLPWHLDDYDQAKQAFTSFEMVERGHWFYQHTPNWWVATKPPLVGWISAAAFAVTRSWELAWRLPSFLGAIALLFLLLRSAQRYGQVAAAIAVGAFSFNLFVPRLASLVRTDMPLALVLFAIGLLIWEKIRTRAGWTNRDRLLLFLLLSAGMLIKGPIVYVFLLPAVVAVAWRWRGTEVAAAAWSGWLPWLVSFLVFLVWVAGGILFVPEFTEHVVLREFAGRFSEGVHRSHPFYFYLPHLLHRWAPWSVLLIGLSIVGLRAAPASRELRPRMSPETFWLLAWGLGGLLVMSFVPSKRIDRIFPIVPPLCLLLAAVVSSLRENERWRSVVDRCCAIALVLSMLFLSGYTVRKIAGASRQKRDAFAVFGRAVLKEASAKQWRYGVVGGEDEGMLLYARQTEFLEPEEAAAGWNSGKLEALVVAEDELAGLLPRLRGSEPRKIMTSNPAGRYRKRYFLLARSTSS
jgi:4-amino-4-deoxy-L-arabinose transferase-like glycosyltransferase